jgi:hypothetical protein
MQVTDAIAVGVLERPGVDLIDDPVFPPNDLSLPIGLPLFTKSRSRSECSLLSIDMTFEARFAEARLRIGRLLSLGNDVSLRKWRATPANGMVGWSGRTLAPPAIEAGQGRQ